MPKNNDAKELFRRDVATANQKAASNLSYRKIYSDVKRIMSKPQENWPRLFLDYTKGLHTQIYKDASHKRTLAFLDKKWSDENHQFLQFSITDSTTLISNFLESCRKAINPEASKNFEYKPEHLDELRDWQLEELNKRKEYQEIAGTVKEWTNDIVESNIANEREKLGLDETDPAKKYTFKGTLDKDLDPVVANIYCRKLAFEEELNKHGRFWRWLFSKRVAVYNNFINKANDLLKEVGFDEKMYGSMAKERSEKALLEPYDMDIASVHYKHTEDLQKYKARHIEQIKVARDYYKWASELKLDPENPYSYESKVRPYAQKYGADISKLSKDGDWQESATAYDTRREVKNFDFTSARNLTNALSAMISGAVSQGKEINISEIMNDARQIAVMSINYNTPAYKLDFFGKSELPPYMQRMDPKLIEGRVKGALGTSVPDDVKEKYVKEAIDVFNEWRANPERLKKEDMEFAKKHTQPEKKLFSPLEVKIANSLLSTDYRPPKKNETDMIVKHEAVMNKLVNQWFNGEDKNLTEANSVLKSNATRLEGMKKLALQNLGNEEALYKSFEDDEHKIKAQYPNYKPSTVQQLDNKGEYHNIENKREICPVHIEETVPLEKKEQIKDDLVKTKSEVVK